MGRSEDFSNARNAHLFGAGMAGLPGSGPVTMAPFDKARGAAAVGRTYDLDVVRNAAVDHDYPLTEVDPRGLRRIQPQVVRDGVQHYLDNPPGGDTYADQNSRAGHHTAGNKHPVIYQTDDGAESVIMSGHHRATAALLSGQMLRAKVVTGPWANDLWKRKQASA